MPGYSADNPNHNHQDLSPLRVGGLLRDEAVNEMGRRLVTPADSLVFYNTFSLEGLYPLVLQEGTRGQPLSDKWFGKMAGGFGRKLGTEVKALVAANYAPSH